MLLSSIASKNTVNLVGCISVAVDVHWRHSPTPLVASPFDRMAVFIIRLPHLVLPVSITPRRGNLPRLYQSVVICSHFSICCSPGIVVVFFLAASHPRLDGLLPVRPPSLTVASTITLAQLATSPVLSVYQTRLLLRLFSRKITFIFAKLHLFARFSYIYRAPKLFSSHSLPPLQVIYCIVGRTPLCRDDNCHPRLSSSLLVKLKLTIGSAYLYC